MKYLYPYECEKRGLSSPEELQAAIDSNRREGRRQSYGSTLFNYSPVGTPTLMASPKLQMPHISMSIPNGGHMTQTPIIKKGVCMFFFLFVNMPQQMLTNIPFSLIVFNGSTLTKFNVQCSPYSSDPQLDTDLCFVLSGLREIIFCLCIL